MPVYLSPATLIVPKSFIAQKYPRGLDKFREDYHIASSGPHQEDDELFGLGSFNADDFYIEALTENGLDFDAENQHSDVCVIVYRYDGPLWEAPWLRENRVFAWHKDASQSALQKLEKICNLTMDQINELSKKGEDVYKAIRQG